MGGELRYTPDRGMRAPRLNLWFSLLAAAAGCSAPHKLISARHTSCPVREVEIRDLVSAPTREDWIAVCRERSFACSTREKGRRLVYACRPLADAGAPDAAIGAASPTVAASPTTENASEPSSTGGADAAVAGAITPTAP